MIYTVATEMHRHTVDWYLEARGRPVARCVAPTSYERLFRRRRAPAGSWIFTDLERLAPRQAELGAELWRALEGCGGSFCLLNHPTRALRRYELLRTLHREGINDADVVRLTDARKPTRYPVFLRGENDHVGPRSGLLADEDALHAELARWEREGRSREDAIVVEFCDTASADGVYRKFSAFAIAGRILPRQIFFSRHWMVKYPDLLEPRWLEEQRNYLETNPHEAELRRIFSLAHIDYGRIDYGLRDGRIQVFEINTNPTLPTIPGSGGPAAEYVNGLFARRLNAALCEIQAATQPAVASVPTAFPIERPGHRALRQLKKALRRRARALRHRRRLRAAAPETEAPVEPGTAR